MGTMRKRIAASVLSALLACGLVPAAAWGAPTGQIAGDGAEAAAASESASAAAEPLGAEGSYAEHEALALVAGDAAAPFSRSGGEDLLAGAESLMGVSAAAAGEALGETASAGHARAAAALALLGDDEDADASAPADGDARVAVPDPAEGEARIVLVRDESRTTEELIAALEADPRVLAAEPNWTLELADEAAQPDADLATEPAVGDSASDTAADSASGAVADDPENAVIADPENDADGNLGNDAVASSGNDTAANSESDAAAPTSASSASTTPDLTGFQWAYGNDGTLGGAGAAGIDMGYDGWNGQVGTTSDDVVVAVVDGGVDAANPDLADKMWNLSDYPEFQAYAQANGLGDEHGFFLPGEFSSSYAGFANASAGHGTHVAGIIAAAWNGEGVSGISQNARLMSVRTSTQLSSVLQCYQYIQAAIAYGVPVKVANNSWTLGASQSQVVNAAVTQLGRLGVTSMFGTGNSATDMDAQSMTAGLLGQNPYAVTVDAVDPTGDMSVFSNYGVQTSHVMAPGSTILSTFPTEFSQYLGEGDDDAVLYESFDEASRTSAAARDLSIALEEESGAHVVAGGKRFDGQAALAVPYAPARLDQESDPSGVQWAQSVPIDLSAVPQGERPRYLSLRYAAAESSYPDAQCVAQAQVAVRTTDGGFANLNAGENSFSAFGDAWGGFYVELPDNVDWRNFQLRVGVMLMAFDMTGGVRHTSPVAGEVLIDSIGMGSDLVPYQYNQGTSMAGPAVAGAAAVLAERFPDDTADERAARIRGAARAASGADWGAYCRTGGMVDVDASADPAPEVSRVEDAGDAVAVTGWFFGDGARATLGGQDAVVRSSAPAADGSDATTLMVEKPDGLAGGRVEVVVTAADGAQGRFFAAIDPASDGEGAALYDQADLPVPANLQDWGAWQLVGFAGDVYALPRFSGSLSVVANPLRYDPQTRTWSEAAPAADVLQEAGVAMVMDITGATLDGSLVLCVTGAGEAGIVVAYLSLDANGSWGPIGHQMVGSTPESRPVLFGTLASDGEQLYAFGGMDTAAGGVESTAVLRVDPASGASEQAGSFLTGRAAPNVAYRDGVFVVSGGIALSLQNAAAQGVERVAAGEDGVLASTAVDTAAVVDETGQLVYGVAAAADGFMLVGPEDRDGAADTYELDAAAGATPQLYDKRASQRRLHSSAALAYDGALYVLAGTVEEPYRVFSATAVDTTAQPGDYVAPEPGPDPEPEPGPDPGPEPTPDPDPNPNPTPDPNPGDEPEDGSGAGSDQTEGAADGGTLEPLVSARDELGGVLAASSLAAAAGIAVAVAAARRLTRR